MSAIAGIFQLNGEPISPEHSAGLMKVLEQFPANDIQTWQNKNIFLGCHAQWITPESVGEKLPYYDQERQLAITADAIIDNREELFSLLHVKKAKQKTMSDSELLLLAYDKWEEQCPKFLVGDFAFMIWDERKQKLFGARDFSGSRTLYYFKDKDRFAFCTIIKSLFTVPYVKKQLDEQWLAEFLAISGMVDAVDTSITPYKDIFQLPPAHSITIENGRMTLSRYCTLNVGEHIKLKSNNDYVEAFQEVFQEAVNSRLRTYRNVGSQLSGGLDSGAVVSFASKSLRLKNKSLYTYSYVPPKNFIDFTPNNLVANERPYIQSTVDYIGDLKHQYLDFEEENPYLDLDDFLETLEMPFKYFENSVWLKGIFEKAQEDGIGVLLTGGRGNLTISWGSALEYYALLLKKIRWLSLSKELNQYGKNIGATKRRIFPYIWKIAYPSFNQIFPSIERYQSRTLIDSQFAEKMDVYSKLITHGMNEQSSTIPDLFNEKSKHFQELFHWNATNTLATKLSLKYSLWKRDPTNDLRVVKFCLSVPEEQYVQNGQDRSLIRRATIHRLPEKVRLNQTVRGVQGVDWVHRMTPTWDQFINDLDQLCNDTQIFKFLNEKEVKDAVSKIKEGPKTDNAINPNYRIAIRSLIVYRFLKNLF
jgi:asparagine synthase (glutamine-hydrolysing)